MYIINYQFLIIIFYQFILSSQKDIALHYPSRLSRSYDFDNNSNCGTLEILAQIVSLFVFVFYILIILGLIKAFLGLCCSNVVAESGLDILLDSPPPDFNRNTLFCLNVIFFLALPFALFQKIRWHNRNCDASCRMHAGAEIIQPCKIEQKKKEVTCNKETTNIKTNKLDELKKKKAIMDVYRDGNDSETQDTKYVLEQLHRSEQSLRSGVYVCSISE